MALSCTRALTSAAMSFKCMLQGLPSNQVEHIPTCGFDIPSFSFPTSVAYNCACPAPCVRRCVITAEYRFALPAFAGSGGTASYVAIPPTVLLNRAPGIVVNDVGGTL